MLNFIKFSSLERIKCLPIQEQNRQYFKYCCDYFMNERNQNQNQFQSNTVTSVSSVSSSASLRYSTINNDCEFLIDDIDGCCILQENGEKIFL